jgi:hypothetical protein
LGESLSGRREQRSSNGQERVRSAIPRISSSEAVSAQWRSSNTRTVGVSAETVRQNSRTASVMRRTRASPSSAVTRLLALLALHPEECLEERQVLAGGPTTRPLGVEPLPEGPRVGRPPACTDDLADDLPPGRVGGAWLYERARLSSHRMHPSGTPARASATSLLLPIPASPSTAMIEPRPSRSADRRDARWLSSSLPPHEGGVHPSTPRAGPASSFGSSTSKASMGADFPFRRRPPRGAKLEEPRHQPLRAGAHENRARPRKALEACGDVGRIPHGRVLRPPPRFPSLPPPRDRC